MNGCIADRATPSGGSLRPAPNDSPAGVNGTAGLPTAQDDLRQIWFDNLVYEPEALRHLIQEAGIGQVVTGSDYPFDMGQYGFSSLLDAVPGLARVSLVDRALDALAAADEAPDEGGDEDCLFLNVWRPTGLTDQDPRPVHVYLHGGGFCIGSASVLRTSRSVSSSLLTRSACTSRTSAGCHSTIWSPVRQPP